MALKSRFILGNKLAGVTNDGTAVTIYSDKFSVRGAPVWSAQIVWTGSTLASTITLWASNFESPNPASDTEWVNMTSDYGYTGFFGGGPAAAAAGKDFVDVSNSGALWYKYKCARTAGTGTIKIIVTAKDS